MVFVSYKASMSDSLESVYLAAKADPVCEAIWLPVPYYTRNPDGSLGEMHFEGADCYGDDIKVTDWQAYDIEAQRPDVIFTFAPFDDFNLVTCIHPTYFCKNLYKFTNMLIYIPYFLAGNGIQEANMAPGCVFAHRVIVQSEKTRASYINLYKEIFHSVGDSFGKPEDKFVAIGSPKFDKTINSRREDFQLPDQWRDLIGKKKVVLYNSSLAAILEGDARYLLKVLHVLETFRKRDDVVLWWRPHPLAQATYGSIRPQLLDKYEQIVALYKAEGFGVFDDTTDLHRAIAWTDAYYGDVSSLIELYQAAGKPVMIADVGVVTEGESWVADASAVESAHDMPYLHENDMWRLIGYVDYVTMHMDEIDPQKRKDRVVGFTHKDGTAGQAICEYAKRHLSAA